MKKITAFLKKQKIFIFLFLVLFILIIFKLSIKKQKPQKEEAPAPLEKQEKYPYSEKDSEKEPGLEKKPGEGLNLVSVYPSKGINKTLFDKYRIFFTFDKSLSLESLSYKITPNISLKSSVEQNKLSFYPSTPFLFNTNYLLEIKRLESIEGNFLNKPIIYKFHLIFPEKLNFDEHH